MQSEWLEMLQREGTVGGPVAMVHAGAEPEGERPCPACGHAAPLVEGCCADCGLHLA